MKRTSMADWFPRTLWIAVLIAGCANDTPVANVEIYSWWVSGAEQSALNAVLRDFATKNPNTSVTNAAAQNALTAQHELQNRIVEGNPPDTFQVNGGAELRQYVEGASPSPLEPLDFLATQQGWGLPMDGGARLMPAEIVQAVSFGPHIYAVPVDIARINALFYNKSAFQQIHLDPPKSMADFVTVSAALQANRVTPVAIGAKVPWTLEVIFKGCLEAAGGANYYTQFCTGHNLYFSGSPTSAPFDSTFNAAVACFATILGAANRDDMRSMTWDQAVFEVRTGVAAMTIMGDWALGEFLMEGAAADDFGEVPAPGSADAFIYTTDTFVLPRGAKNRAGAISLLTEWGSAAGQSAFYPLKGTLATRWDVGQYDSISKKTMADFMDQQIQRVPDWALAMPQAFTTNFDLALDRFAYDGNAENLVLAAKNNYDLVVAGHWP
jgi:glucose/mannose transport system substrate-binding protein